MPTRKQRRRRKKSFRHEYEYVVVDEEGNEVEVDPAEARAKKETEKPDRADRTKAASSSKGRGSARTARVVEPPSWRRSIRRGGTFGAIMFVVVVFFFRDTPLPGRIASGLFYALAFIPFTYWMDRVAYRMYLKRSGQLPAREPKEKRQPPTRSPR